MSYMQHSASSSIDREASPEFSPDYGSLDLPDLPLPSEPRLGHQGATIMENYEMERYVLQSLEILASTPTTQYYGSEIPRSDADPRSALSLVSHGRWDGRTSFQQVQQRVIGGNQDSDQQPCYAASSSSTAPSSSAIAPIYTKLNYHDHAIPEDPSMVEISHSQTKAVEPMLKRQRNTAASARFRAKKKRNEQIQAQNAREREAILNRLENKVTELETEIRWLKDLLMDRAEVTARKDGKATAEDRKGYERKDGVGTSA